MKLDPKERLYNEQMLTLALFTQKCMELFPNANLYSVHDELRCDVEDTPENRQLSKDLAEKIKSDLAALSDDELMAKVEQVRSDFRKQLMAELM